MNFLTDEYTVTFTLRMLERIVMNLTGMHPTEGHDDKVSHPYCGLEHE